MRVRSLLGVPATLPIPLTRKVPTRIHTVSALAPRDVRMSCAAISPMPRNAMPVVADVAPMSQDPPASSFDPISARATSRPRTMFAATPWMTVAIVGSARPAGVAATSSDAAGLFIAAGVPDGEERAHEGGEHRQPRQDLEREELPSDAPDGSPRNIMMTGFAITAASTSTRSACVAVRLGHARVAGEGHRGPWRGSTAAPAASRAAGAAGAGRIIVTPSPWPAVRRGCRSPSPPNRLPPHRAGRRGHRRSAAGTAPRGRAARCEAL